MRIVIFLLLNAINCLHLSAQTIQKFYDYRWKETDVSNASFLTATRKTDAGVERSDYFIHTKTLQMIGTFTDETLKVENGLFRYYFSNKNLQHEGYYVMGKKLGIWKSYHYNGRIADSTCYRNDLPSGKVLRWHANGFRSDSIVYDKPLSFKKSWYDNGKVSSYGHFIDKEDSLCGEWIFYHKNGNKSAEELYDTAGKLIRKKNFNESGMILSDTTFALDKPAQYKGGITQWYKFITRNLRFPKNVNLTNTNKVVVVVTFSINEEGYVENAYVSIPFYVEFDILALQTVLDSPKWQPEISHNRRVKSSNSFAIPVTFKQN